VNGVPVVLAGHGGYAEGVRSAAEMILGPQQGLACVALSPAGTIEQVTEDAKRALERLGAGDAGALLLVDVAGGSPAGAAGRLALTDPGVQVVAGLNLPMVLEVLTSAEGTAAALAAVASRAGAEGVIDVAARLRAAASRAREATA
jgi:PTS system mannose-specific IIA component